MKACVRELCLCVLFVELVADCDSFIEQKVQSDVFRPRVFGCISKSSRASPFRAVSVHNGRTILLQAWFSHVAVF